MVGMGPSILHNHGCWWLGDAKQLPRYWPRATGEDIFGSSYTPTHAERVNSLLNLRKSRGFNRGLWWFASHQILVCWQTLSEIIRILATFVLANHLLFDIFQGPSGTGHQVLLHFDKNAGRNSEVSWPQGRCEGQMTVIVMSNDARRSSLAADETSWVIINFRTWA